MQRAHEIKTQARRRAFIAVAFPLLCIALAILSVLSLINDIGCCIADSVRQYRDDARAMFGGARDRWNDGDSA